MYCTYCEDISPLLLSMWPGVLFLVQFNNFFWLLLSYMLLLKLTILMCSLLLCELLPLNYDLFLIVSLICLTNWRALQHLSSHAHLSSAAASLRHLRKSVWEMTYVHTATHQRNIEGFGVALAVYCMGHIHPSCTNHSCVSPSNGFGYYIIVHVSLFLLLLPVHDQSSELGCSVLSRRLSSPDASLHAMAV